jgi:hypothetical protein
MAEYAFRAKLGEVTQNLFQEHNREVQLLYNDNLSIRKELEVVSALMQEFLQREQHLKQVLHTLTDAHANFGKGLQNKVAHVSSQIEKVGGSANKHRNDSEANMQNTANEIERIRRILSVAPALPPGLSDAGMAPAQQNAQLLRPFPPSAGSTVVSQPARSEPVMQQTPPPPYYANSPYAALAAPSLPAGDRSSNLQGELSRIRQLLDGGVLQSQGDVPQFQQQLQASRVPMATVGIDTTGDGRANLAYVGVDRNRDGIPDALQASRVPMATIGIDTTGDGRANLAYVGVDRNRDGIPDALQASRVPMATIGIDTTGDGRANLAYVGVDMNRDGIPDALQTAASAGSRTPPVPVPVQSLGMTPVQCNCGYIFRDDASFCRMCGAPRSQAIPLRSGRQL